MSGLDFAELVAARGQLAAVPGAIAAKANPIVRRSGYEVVRGAKVNVTVNGNVDTGSLLNSISVDFDGDGLGYQAGPTVEHGLFIEDGTHGPYIIPNAFGRGGFVEHPGISASPYMGPSFDNQLEDLDGRLLSAAADVLR